MLFVFYANLFNPVGVAIFRSCYLFNPVANNVKNPFFFAKWFM